MKISMKLHAGIYHHNDYDVTFTNVGGFLYRNVQMLEEEKPPLSFFN